MPLNTHVLVFYKNCPLCYSAHADVILEEADKAACHKDKGRPVDTMEFGNAAGPRWTSALRHKSLSWCGERAGGCGGDGRGKGRCIRPRRRGGGPAWSRRARTSLVWHNRLWRGGGLRRAGVTKPILILGYTGVAERGRAGRGRHQPDGVLAGICAGVFGRPRCVRGVAVRDAFESRHGHGPHRLYGGRRYGARAVAEMAEACGWRRGLCPWVSLRISAAADSTAPEDIAACAPPVRYFVRGSGGDGRPGLYPLR